MAWGRQRSLPHSPACSKLPPLSQRSSTPLLSPTPVAPQLVVGSCVVEVWCVQLCAEAGFETLGPRGHPRGFWVTTSLCSALTPHHSCHLRADPIVNLTTDVTNVLSADGSHAVLPWALAPELWGWWRGGLSGGHTWLCIVFICFWVM